MSFTIEVTGGKVKEINKRIEVKQGELKDLEKNKKNLYDARMAIERSTDLDENVKKTLAKVLGDAINENTEKGKALSAEMSDDYRTLDELMTETRESKESNQQERTDLEKKKKFLEPFGLEKKVDDAITELDNNKKDLEDLETEIDAARKEHEKTSSKLSHLSLG